MKAYTLKKDADTSELHLFEGDMKADGSCTSAAKSVCKKMSKSLTTENLFSCKNDKDARIKCAEVGRKVCGICVSHLYTTYL